MEIGRDREILPVRVIRVGGGLEVSISSRVTRSRALYLRWDRVKLMAIPGACGLNGRFGVHRLEGQGGTKPAR